MAEKYTVPNMGISIPTTATPVIAMAQELDWLQDLNMSNGPDLFPMDGSGFEFEEDNINTLGPLTAEVDQSQVRGGNKSC